MQLNSLVHTLSTQNSTETAVQESSGATIHSGRHIHSVALVILIGSLIASFCLLLSTWLNRRYDTVGQRLPIYLGITNLAMSSTHLFDHVYTLVNERVLPARSCAVAGGMFQFWFMAQLLLVAAMAVSMIYSTARNRPITYGCYDVKLVVPVFAGAFASTAISGLLNLFGSAGHWCYIATTGRMAYSASVIFHLVFPLLTLLTAIGGYAYTHTAMHRSTRRMKMVSSKNYAIFISTLINDDDDVLDDAVAGTRFARVAQHITSRRASLRHSRGTHDLAAHASASQTHASDGSNEPAPARQQRRHPYSTIFRHKPFSFSPSSPYRLTLGGLGAASNNNNNNSSSSSSSSNHSAAPVGHGETMNVQAGNPIEQPIATEAGLPASQPPPAMTTTVSPPTHSSPTHSGSFKLVNCSVTQHSIAYMLAFIAQWVPVLIYVLYVVASWDQPAMPMCVVALFNLAGMLHFAVYYWNQRNIKQPGLESSPSNFRQDARSPTPAAASMHHSHQDADDNMWLGRRNIGLRNSTVFSVSTVSV
ncbi:hypothetical protein THASP1DRAFT_32439 [Thamnocephalis sphaerospora]|uniref:Uncharacterized protein n=1 Tax=Thamnocephalis sphaerospora TaxID=78915 RepID=A0A4P9XJ17_9FUNG|nr:hypothetical protein THASP1DRAFT_32439 [Thamnocephalis sphaerospora]|eukprot:RKP05722.1 hypothetical protein THASP1DRAFT_32439 [Thamnocephalis sphaerospora]